MGNVRSSPSLNESQKSLINQTESALVAAEEPTDDARNWVTAVSEIVNGTIVCQVPKLEQYDQDSLLFDVDVALNMQ
jgi:hypothetical protein